MNCDGFLDRLDEYLENRLSELERQTADSHLRACAGCRQKVEYTRGLRTALRAMPVPPPHPRFFDTALAHARKRHAARRARRSIAAGAALAASVAVGLIVGVLLRAPQNRDGELAVSMALHVPRDVQLAFNSEQELKQVEVRIRLPDGVEIKGYPDQHEIHWRTDLARGVNLLSLPLVAVSSDGGTLVARLEHDGRSRELSVRLIVNDSRSDGARLDDCVSSGSCRPGTKELNHASV